MVRRVQNSRVAYLIEKQITSIHDNIVTWRKEPKVLNYITNPRDKCTPSISLTCPAVTAESSMSFRASLSMKVTVKPSPVASKSTRGYKNFKIDRVRLTDYFMLARMISQDLVGRLSNIWGRVLRMRTRPGRKMLLHYPPSASRR
jgi:hypothetical protein